jgi:hypothetical protein
MSARIVGIAVDPSSAVMVVGCSRLVDIDADILGQ